MKPKERIYKLAQSMLMDDPKEAGRNLAIIIHFLLKKIDYAKRLYAVWNLKQKINNLNENEMAKKKSPASASLGQSITFIKTILNGKPPAYIRSVLNEVIRNL